MLVLVPSKVNLVDLKSVSMTGKAIRHAAAPRLYKTWIIKAANENDLDKIDSKPYLDLQFNHKPLECCQVIQTCTGSVDAST